MTNRYNSINHYQTWFCHFSTSINAALPLKKASLRPSHPSLFSPLPLIYTATRSGIRRREIYKNRNIILTYFESWLKNSWKRNCWFVTFGLLLNNIAFQEKFINFEYVFDTAFTFTVILLLLCLPDFLSVYLLGRLSISLFVHVVLVCNYVVIKMYIYRLSIYLLYAQEVVTLQKKYLNIFASEN